MRDLVIMPAMAQRRESLNMGEFAEEAIIVEEVAAPKRVNHFIEANRVVWMQWRCISNKILRVVFSLEKV